MESKKRIMRAVLLVLCTCFFFSCSDLELSERERDQREKAEGEFIERDKDEVIYPYEIPKLQKRSPYKWEK